MEQFKTLPHSVNIVVLKGNSVISAEVHTKYDFSDIFEALGLTLTLRTLTSDVNQCEV